MGISRDITGRGFAGPADNQGRGGENALPPFRAHELARRWGVPEQSVTAVLRSGRLRGFKLQKIWLVPRENVERFERGESVGR